MIGSSGRTCLAALAMFLAVTTPASAETDALFGDLAGTTLFYDINVGDAPSGHAKGTILRTEDGNWEVRMETKIEVEVIGGISIYSLHMSVSEIYGGGVLVGLDVDARENDQHNRMTGRMEGSQFRFTHNGKVGTGDRNLVPSTQLWRERMLQRKRVLHVIDGEMFERRISAIGKERVSTDKGVLDLNGYTVESPDERATLWFDPDGLLYKAELERLGVTLVIQRRA
ncbi:MAG: DUF6134 family protein [Alphaproteobacteria bacterium]